jgi:hypothetical protein
MPALYTTPSDLLDHSALHCSTGINHFFRIKNVIDRHDALCYIFRNNALRYAQSIQKGVAISIHIANILEISMPNLLDDFEDLPEITERSSWFDVARKVVLAGIGAVVLAQEEIECFVGKLVERGELAEKEGKQLIEDMKLWRFRAKKEMPTATDLSDLQAKIDLLSVQVDHLLGGK